jgi:protein-S-isoprenylcysteine O-methyltransferase Ste14
MNCRNCGTEIADKALICYRCGTATAAPRIAPPPPRKQRGPLPLIATLVLIAAVAAFLVPTLPPDSTQAAGWGLAVVLAALAVWRLRPASRQRLRRPK